jgi:outer membrane receptor for ferrienterochelin and colicins
VAKYFITLSLLFCFYISAFAGRVVSVEITDAKTDDRIIGATITVAGTSYIASGNKKFEIAINTGDSAICTATGYEKTVFVFDKEQSFFVIAMRPVADNLGDVVVSGTMRQVSKLESPIPVESYSARFFKKNPTPNIFEALTIVNGVQPQLNCNVCNTGDIHINGMEGPYTMILIDGMPIVSSLSTVYGLSGIPSSLVKRIEVVKGPASTLYGSDAVGGLINIITKDVLTANRLSVEANVTSVGEMGVDIATTLKAGKSHGILGVNIFNYWNKQDVNHDNFTDITQQQRVSVFNKWNFERKDYLAASLAARFFAEERWGGELNWNKNFKGSDSIYGESIVTKRLELIGNIAISKPLMFEYSYNYHNQDSYYGKIKYAASQHTAFAQLRWDKTLGKHNLLAGVPIKYIWYDDNTVATQKDNKNKPSVITTTSFFIQDEIKFSPAVSTLVGLRYEYTNVQGSVFAPRLAVKWQLDKQQTIRLSTGNGFRIVNLFTEDHAALTGAREVIIKSDLKPEQSWNANINYTGQVSRPWGFLSLDASMFYTYFTNRILPDYDTDPQKIFYDNLQGHAISKGITLNADVATRKGLKALLGFTLMDVFAVENGRREEQFNAPKFTLNYSVSYTIQRWNTSFDLTGKTYSPQRLPVVPNDFRPGYSPWFSLMNLQATKKINSNLELYLSVKNLLNFVPSNPILHPDDPFNKPGGKYFLADGTANPVTNPFNYTFDPSSSYAPMQGIKGMLGVRWSVN